MARTSAAHCIRKYSSDTWGTVHKKLAMLSKTSSAQFFPIKNQRSTTTILTAIISQNVANAVYLSSNHAQKQLSIWKQDTEI
jgi:hypothetical protein